MPETNWANGKRYAPDRRFWSHFKASERLPHKYLLVHKWLPFSLEFSDLDQVMNRFLDSSVWKLVLKKGKVLCERK